MRRVPGLSGDRDCLLSSRIIHKDVIECRSAHPVFVPVGRARWADKGYYALVRERLELQICLVVSVSLVVVSLSLERRVQIARPLLLRVTRPCASVTRSKACSVTDSSCSESHLYSLLVVVLPLLLASPKPSRSGPLVVSSYLPGQLTTRQGNYVPVGFVTVGALAWPAGRTQTRTGSLTRCRGEPEGACVPSPARGQVPAGSGSLSPARPG
eukprot:414636-Rhodomonas_salina.1